ncbi:unnamed protein product [Triticum turgidum subsp. durum]|uniref:Uncharacterized protein n=1 Tax=Triticum turgidum subsp. durum TaxID=4567 RepID=A0A9R1QX01_TRITD|nr:unnamed protein product [Triticum turgidum subsp. durum]
MNEYDERGQSGDESRVRPEAAPGLFAWTYIRQPRPPLPPVVQRERDREIPNPQNPNPPGEEEAFFMVRKEPDAAILKAKAMAKSKADKQQEVVRKAKAKAEAEAAVRKAKAEAGVFKACCCGSDEDDVPYDKVYHDSDAEEDRIVARWDIFMEEEKARFPDQKYRVYLPGERTGDESSDSDDEHEYYLRKFGMMK